MKNISPSQISLLAGTLFVGVLTGCMVEGHAPHARVHVSAPPPPVVHVQAAVVVQDDYVYYPAYEVYYSSSRHHYYYRDGSAWVTRPAPPRVSASVLFASPSVRLDFHDAPSRHHSTVSRQYPKHWAPPGHSRDNDRRDDNDKGKSGK
jgi:hypothetical protein